MNTRTIIALGIALIIFSVGWWLLVHYSKAPVPAGPVPVAQNGQEGQKDTNPAEYVDGNLLLGADGSHLIGYNGMTLYTYDKDPDGVSLCNGQCATNWPPYVITSTSVLSNVQAGIGGKVGSITHTDGRMQVTYNGKPLYFWVKDTKSGDANGDGVGGFSVAKP
jgi:predicted lipoprotein with Yx(FWY)xxD motif